MAVVNVSPVHISEPRRKNKAGARRTAGAPRIGQVLPFSQGDGRPAFAEISFSRSDCWGRRLARRCGLASFLARVGREKAQAPGEVFMNPAHVVDHPLVQHKLTLMRNKQRSTKGFRQLMNEIGMLLCYEVTRDLPTELVEVETPLAKTMAPMIAGKKLVFAPILRAGVGFLDGMLELVPSARVAHIGLYRDPKTLEAVEYYFKAPADVADRLVIVMDPMLATANSAVAAIDRLKRRGVKEIRFVCLLAAPEGVERLSKAHPDVQIWTAAIDERLNDHGYILPGLGDAGDRMFGTK